MKTNAFIRMALLGTLAVFVMQSCSNDDEPILQEPETNFTVRPDFATLDTRPDEVIADFKITDLHTKPVPLNTLKTTGKYALVIGISDYDGTANDLNYCDDDAIDWKNRLETEGYTVTTLLDQNATYTAIQNAVYNLASLSSTGNEIAFCYSGHGSRGNIISSDLYYINNSWFETTFANAASTKMMFCFDACQIGEMTALDAPGRVVAVASNRRLYSYDGDASMQNGVFTYYMMEGFDQVGYIYLEPDCQYAIDNMELWASYYKIRVAPSYVDSYVGDFDL